MERKVMREIRQAARILHWVTQVLLVAAFIYTVWGGFRVAASGFILQNFLLGNVHWSLVTAQTVEEQVRLLDVSRLPPPTDAAAWPAWGERVAAALPWPATVFAKQGTELTPVIVSPGHEAALEKARLRFRSDAPKKDRLDLDTLDGLQRWFGFLRADSLRAQVTAFESQEGGLGWGVVYGENAGWPEFVRKLSTPASSRGLSRPAHLATIMAAHSLWSKPAMRPDDKRSIERGFRVLQGDSVLVSSPAIDSALLDPDAFPSTWEEDVGGLHFEYFPSGWDRHLLKPLGRGHFPWLLLGFEAGLMVIVFLFHRWIRRLTAEAVKEEG